MPIPGARQRKAFRFKERRCVQAIIYVPGRSKPLRIRLCSWEEARIVRVLDKRGDPEDDRPVWRTAADKAWSTRYLRGLREAKYLEVMREAEERASVYGHRLLSEVGKDWLKWLAELERSSGYRASAQETLGYVHKACGPLPIGALDRHQLDKLTSYLRGRGQAMTTVNLHLRNLRALVRWAQERGEMSPELKVREHRARRKIAVVPKPEDVQAVFRHLEKLQLHPYKPTRARARKLYRYAMLASGLGPRRSEIAFARWEDLDLERGVLPVRKSAWSDTKERRDKNLLMPAWLLAYLQAERALHRDEVFVLGDRPGGGPGYDALRSLTQGWRRVLDDLGLRAKYPGIKPTHVFRAYYASTARRHGVDKRTIGGLLGQSNPESTEHYFGAEDDLQLAAVRLMDGADPRKVPPNSHRGKGRLRK